MKTLFLLCCAATLHATDRWYKIRIADEPSGYEHWAREVTESSAIQSTDEMVIVINRLGPADRRPDRPPHAIRQWNTDHCDHPECLNLLRSTPHNGACPRLRAAQFLPPMRAAGGPVRLSGF
jgi:hypothetical protein